MPTTPSSQDWLRLKAEVEQAALEVQRWHPRLLLVLRKAGQEHQIAAVVHAQIVSRLLRSRVATEKRPGGNEDLLLFGRPCEIKTSSRLSFTGNKSTARLNESPRLLIAVNWCLLGGVIRAWLVRFGDLHPASMQGIGGDTMQFASIPTQDLVAIAPNPEQWPTLVGGGSIPLVAHLGPAAIARLGNPASVAELRQVVAARGTIADKQNLAAFGSHPKLAEHVGWGGRRLG